LEGWVQVNGLGVVLDNVAVDRGLAVDYGVEVAALQAVPGERRKDLARISQDPRSARSGTLSAGVEQATCGSYSNGFTRLGLGS
jgi:hypothetical protein